MTEDKIRDYYLVRISTDGTVELFTTKKTPELQQLYDLIGCDLVETVRIDNDVLMIVDESFQSVNSLFRHAVQHSRKRCFAEAQPQGLRLESVYV